jgi:excisionase family DNA binding protein
MTPEELADFLRIGRTMSYRLLSEGSIPSYRIGRVRRVHRDDVLDYLQRNRAC